MESTTDKITKAQGLFNQDPELSGKLGKHLETKNYSAYSNDFSSAAKTKGIEVSADDVTKHFGFNQENPTMKKQVTEFAKDEVKGAAKDEATGQVEDEIGNQLGVNVSGVGGAAEEVGGFFKGLFGKKKK